MCNRLPTHIPGTCPPVMPLSLGGADIEREVVYAEEYVHRLVERGDLTSTGGAVLIAEIFFLRYSYETMQATCDAAFYGWKVRHG